LTHAGALLVIAGAQDEAALAFVRENAAVGATLVTPRDFSREGWRLSLGDPGAVAAAERRLFRADEIGGVLTRLPRVLAADLPHIAEEDRAYVAAEMTAFLLAFLTLLPCRVANRPTTQCLCGPDWRDEKWRRFARNLGLGAPPSRRRATASDTFAPECELVGAMVTFVGGECLGATDAGQAAGARALAQAAGADLLAVQFESAERGAGVLRASPLVDLRDAQIAAATLALFDRYHAPPPTKERHDPALGH
jgi:hypothetical protein